MLFVVSSSSIMIIKSCFPANKEGDTPPNTAAKKPFRIILVKRLVRSYSCSFILKLSHGATTNIELLLSYVVLRVGQMSYTA